MLASAPRRQGGGAAHEIGRKRAAEAAEEEGAAALRVAEQEEVGEQPVGDHGVHGVGLGRAPRPTRDPKVSRRLGRQTDSKTLVHAESNE